MGKAPLLTKVKNTLSHFFRTASIFQNSNASRLNCADIKKKKTRWGQLVAACLLGFLLHAREFSSISIFLIIGSLRLPIKLESRFLLLFVYSLIAPEKENTFKSHHHNSFIEIFFGKTCELHHFYVF